MRVYTGLDLSRKRLDWHACRVDGMLVDAGAVPPDLDGLAQLVHRLGDGDVLAVVETMNGARFVHDRLELAGWDVRIADAQRARALAPLACKTDRIDAQVLAELARRDLVRCRRCGCPIRACAVSVSGLASASTWSSTAPCSRTGSTRRWSHTGLVGRRGTSSVQRAASCSSGCRCPSRGTAPSVRAYS
jgi:hypothetical protein